MGLHPRSSRASSTWSCAYAIQPKNLLHPRTWGIGRLCRLSSHGVESSHGPAVMTLFTGLIGVPQ
ncbi:hypothetical protein AG1IA_10188 [Rhizoctonia solani AG-1 IA]|uniref:Uncharacterized protein n=1 Tax=Thanatephorus cucumeris (strain AG1-IA) TaxID=983506 RepID=L8WGF7_THACA|nr:hypothetical protein AG1IA_10188 [Rhizoctonia solani AG-1 IA]